MFFTGSWKRPARNSRVGLLFLLFVICFAIGWRYSRSASAAPECNDSLWKHVYDSDRLTVHAKCASVTGMIVDATAGKHKDGVRHEADGDCHGWLKLDHGQQQYLNVGNKSNEGGNLVFEIVCMFPVKQDDAKAACKGYTNKIVLPPVGSHVRITGSWIMDDNHAKWNEIHPVSSIEVIR